jgi:hypothetical protein
MPQDPHHDGLRCKVDDPVLVARVLKVRAALLAEGAGRSTTRLLKERLGISIPTINRIVRNAGQ